VHYNLTVSFPAVSFSLFLCLSTISHRLIFITSPAISYGALFCNPICRRPWDAAALDSYKRRTATAGRACNACVQFPRLRMFRRAASCSAKSERLFRTVSRVLLRVVLLLLYYPFSSSFLLPV